MTDDDVKNAQPAPIDDAIVTAVNRTAEAEEAFVATPVRDPVALTRSAEVQRRAEDLEALAEEAAEAERRAGEAGRR